MNKICIICVAFAVLALSGCSAPAPVMPQTLVATKTIYQPFVWPAYLKTCQADPAPFPIPHIVATDPKAGSQVAKYILGLRAHDASVQGVADDCRDTLAAALAADTALPAPAAK